MEKGFKEFSPEEKTFLSEFEKDCSQYINIFKDIYVVKILGDNEVHHSIDCIDRVKKEVFDFVAKKGIDVDFVAFDDKSLLPEASRIMDRIIKLNRASGSDVSLETVNNFTVLFFTKLNNLVGGNKELREKLNELTMMIKIEFHGGLKMENFDGKPQSVETVNNLLLNVEALNEEVKYLIQEIRMMRNQRKSSPELSDHFLAGIKRSLEKNK